MADTQSPDILKQQKGQALSQDSWSLCKRLFRDYMRPHMGKLVLAQCAIIVVACVTFAQVRMLEPIFDRILVEGERQWLYVVPVIFLLLSILRGLGLYLQNRQIALVGHEVIKQVQNQLYRCLIKGDIAPILSDQTGKLMSRFTFDMQLVRNVVTQSLIGTVRDSVLLLVYLVNLFYTNWQLAIVIGFIFPIAIFPIIYVGRKLRAISYHLQEETGTASAFLDESFKGIVQIKAYSSENFMLGRANNIFQFLFKTNFRQDDVRARIHPVTESLFGVAMAITILVSGYQVINGQTTVGAFMSFFAALILAYQPVRSLSVVNARLQEGLAAVDRLFQMMARKVKVDDVKNAKDLKVTKGAITISKVHFSYGDEMGRALHDVSIAIKGGQKIALVGPSGAGKSTLFNLMLRFYDPSSGHIAIDGQNIKNVTRFSLRQNIALVSQEQGIFNDTIAANIALGDADIDEARIRHAAKMADADGFINRLEQKYQTMAGENGNRLSGGQKQRLAIARAIYKDAPILILDEATSALDQRTEKNIQKALSELMKNRTVLIIAHRLSTVKDADMIYVFEHGRICESGRHDSLIAQNGLYALLHKKGDGFN